MTNFIIKTHRVGTIYSKPHLFLLNKGMNSGKPQKEPFTNSFVVIFDLEQDCENLFFIASLESIIENPTNKCQQWKHHSHSQMLWHRPS